jgi:hypothetical protein
MPGNTSDSIQIHISIKQSTDLCLPCFVRRAMRNTKPFTELSITIIDDSRFQVRISAKDIFRIFDADFRMQYIQFRRGYGIYIDYEICFAKNRATPSSSLLSVI